MDNALKIERFGYDPTANLAFIGTAPVLFRGQEEKCEFYYSAKSRRIEVCFYGCNGTYTSGTEISETETTLLPNFNEAFFAVKNRFPQGYSLAAKPWIGRIVATLKETPKGYESGPLHFDVFYDAASGSIDLHSVGVCSPMFRAIMRPDGTTTLPEELVEICKSLCARPQTSLEEHNTTCEECAAELARKAQS